MVGPSTCTGDAEKNVCTSISAYQTRKVWEVSVELPAKGAQVGVEVTNRGLKAITKVSGRPKSVLVSIEDGTLLMREGTGREAVL